MAKVGRPRHNKFRLADKGKQVAMLVSPDNYAMIIRAKNKSKSPNITATIIRAVRHYESEIDAGRIFIEPPDALPMAD